MANHSVYVESEDDCSEVNAVLRELKTLGSLLESRQPVSVQILPAQEDAFPAKLVRLIETEEVLSLAEEKADDRNESDPSTPVAPAIAVQNSPAQQDVFPVKLIRFKESEQKLSLAEKKADGHNESHLSTPVAPAVTVQNSPEQQDLSPVKLVRIIESEAKKFLAEKTADDHNETDLSTPVATHPQAASSSWRRVASRSQPGEFYYFNDSTEEHRIDPPHPWHKIKSKSNPGMFYYFNPETSETSWVKPFLQASIC